MVESDSLPVTQFVNSKCHTCTELFWIILEIQMLTSAVEKFKIRHIPGCCNHAADVLAKFFLQCLESLVWFEDYPSFLECYL